MRIVMLSSNTALSGKMILRELVKNRRAPSLIVVESFLPPGEGFIPRTFRFAGDKVKTWGWKYVARKSAGLLASKIFPGAPLECITLRALASREGLAVCEVDDFNSTECADRLRETQPTIGVVSGTRILKKEIFQIPRLGCLNFHTGLLPKYRGSDTIIWSLYHHDPVGVTIHMISEKLDAGEVILEKEVTVAPTDTYGSIYAKACRAGAAMIIQILTNPDYYLSHGIVKYDPESPPWKKAPEEVIREVRKMRKGFF